MEQAERREIRRAREAAAVASRLAFQRARYWADRGNAGSAHSWADQAVAQAERFKQELSAELPQS